MSSRLQREKEANEAYLNYREYFEDNYLGMAIDNYSKNAEFYERLGSKSFSLCMKGAVVFPSPNYIETMLDITDNTIHQLNDITSELFVTDDSSRACDKRKQFVRSLKSIGYVLVSNEEIDVPILSSSLNHVLPEQIKKINQQLDKMDESKFGKCKLRTEFMRKHIKTRTIPANKVFYVSRMELFYLLSRVVFGFCCSYLSYGNTDFSLLPENRVISPSKYPVSRRICNIQNGTLQDFSVVVRGNEEKIPKRFIFFNELDIAKAETPFEIMTINLQDKYLPAVNMLDKSRNFEKYNF